MNPKSILLAGAVFALSLTACTRKVLVVHDHHHKPKKVYPMPPGQAKKITGHKSAKSHAPGQRKKHH